MNRNVLRVVACMITIAAALSTMLLSACGSRTRGRLTAGEIRKAMHDDLFVSHEIVDFIISDNDGTKLLAERLSKDPVAARVMLETLVKKGGAETAIAEMCAQAAARRQRSAIAAPGAQELQRQAAGGKQ